MEKIGREEDELERKKPSFPLSLSLSLSGHFGWTNWPWQNSDGPFISLSAHGDNLRGPPMPLGEHKHEQGTTL